MLKPCRIYFFSPNGTTQKVTHRIAEGLNIPMEEHDLLRSPLRKEERITEGETVLVGVPVYAGRIPKLCREMLERIEACGNPAIAVVAYGNRDYDDALIELKDLMEGSGLHVIAAGAFVSQHSIFPRVAQGRPDSRDFEVIDAFALRCKELLGQHKMGIHTEVRVKGNKNYKTPGSIPLKPSANGACTNCGLCAKICPTGSIPKENTKLTKKETCISCGACVHFCPHQARGFRGPAYLIAEKSFNKKCVRRREPEVFYGEEQQG